MLREQSSNFIWCNIAFISTYATKPVETLATPEMDAVLAAQG
jgi:hypothetical protein